jgi:DNA-binding NarL/FixJ family response regulator
MNSAPEGDFILTAEERRIIALIVRGLTNKGVARRLSLGESTIKRRIVRILGKLRVTDRIELVLYALSRGIVKGASNRSSSRSRTCR